MDQSTQTLGEGATLGRAERLIQEIRRKTHKGISAKDKITPLGPEQFKTLCLSVHRLSSYLNQNPRL
jgi:hypothetical protein